MQLSLRWRAIISVTLLLLISLSGLSIFLFSYLPDIYLDSYRSNISSEIQIFADQIAIPLGDEDTPRINSEISKFSNALNLRVTVILPDGVVIGDSTASPGKMDNHLTRPEVQGALQGQAASNVRYSNTLKTEMLYVAAPIWEEQNIIGVARFAISLQQLNKNLQVIKNTILGAVVVTAIFGLIMASLVSDYALTPLRELTTKIKGFNQSGIKSLEPTSYKDEIGQLDRAFTSLAHELNAQIEALKAEQSKLNAILSNMSDGFLIVSNEGKIKLLNPAAEKLFNIRQEQALNASIVEVVRNHEIINLWKRSIESRTQQSESFETGPERFYLQVFISPMQSSMPDHTMIAFHDISHLRKLEMVRRDFVSNVSHELRTPLASLKSISETLIEGALEDPPAAKRFLFMMEEEIDNLTQLVQELLELSRIESGRVPLNRVSITPYDILHKPVSRMKFQAERASLQLVLDCDRDLPPVYADQERIAQVIINLIHNAIKFTPPNGTITVKAEYDDSRIIFSVKDTGVGIEPENLRRIFERFYKADKARSGGGTGLGLSISKHMINAHGGKIWVESAFGEGSTFKFSLPLA